MLPVVCEWDGRTTGSKKIQTTHRRFLYQISGEEKRSHYMDMFTSMISAEEYRGTYKCGHRPRSHRLPLMWAMCN